jgi:NADH-quinone oxidoreductase subunit L
VKVLLISMLLLPLLGSVFHALAGSRLPRGWSQAVAVTVVTAALVLAVAAAIVGAGLPITLHLLHWFAVGPLTVAMTVLYDPLSAVMAIMVTLIAVPAHIFSVFYLPNTAGHARYYFFSNIFVFFMLVIVTTDNLIFMLLGWQAIGFCSYALIGFWYQENYRVAAARRAFVMTSIGSAALGIAIGLVFVGFGTLSVLLISHHAVLLRPEMAIAIGLLLVLAAAANAALLPLSVWMPGATAAPAPVSAFVHGSTMVAAGIFLLLRLYPVVAASPITLGAAAAAGVLTALYGACCAVAQSDIKRVLAYATISHSGFMLLGIGVMDPTGSLFHLLALGFFNTLLFLAAGCITHSLTGERNVFKMGPRLRKVLPKVYGCFLIGALSLAAVPPTMGFFSRDRLLLSTLIQPGWFHVLLWSVAACATLITAVYIFRLFFVVFFPGAENGSMPEPGPRPIRQILIRTLYPLALLCLLGGLINLPVGTWNLLDNYLSSVPGHGPPMTPTRFLERFIRIGNALIVIVGVGLAYFVFGPRTKADPAAPNRLRDLLLSGFYLERLYDGAIVRPYEKIARFLYHQVDQGGLDAALIGGGRFLMRFSLNLRLWATGRLSTYLGALLLGFAVMLGILALSLI